MTMKTKSKDEAYDTIKELILSTTINPGQNITENALAEQLGIGRTPVREALTRLESEGLILSSKGRKTVYSLTLDEIREIFDVKQALEGAVAGWAAIRGSEKDKELLADMMADMKAFAQNRPEENGQRDTYLSSWIKIDYNLHQVIFRMASCKKAEEIIRKLNMQWHRTRVSVYALEGRTARSAKEHETFVQHIIDGNAAKAEAAMKAHLQILTEEIEHAIKLFSYPIR